MVRMKDVLKSYNDLKKDSSIPQDQPVSGSQTPPSSGTLSGLDAIRNAIQSGLAQQKQQAQKPVSPPPSQKSTLDRLKTALEQKDKPATTQSSAAPTPEKKEEKLSPDDEQFSTKLYMTFHHHMEKISNDIKNGKPVDPGPLIKDIPDFCEAIESQEFLFIKAIQRKRFATWFVSHSVNVGIFAVKIGLGLKFERDKLQSLALSALLHDVGMIKVSTKILFKHGKLSPAEFDQMKKHSTYGYELLKHLKNEFPFVVDTAYQEHEREDGSGYPRGLKADEIHLFAKIVGIADVFEALVHGRAYRDGFITYHAIQKILENKSKQFNVKVIRGLVNSVSMFPVGSYVKLSSNEVARVITVNKLRPVRPVVEVIEDAEGRKLKTPLRINLEEEPLLYITKPLSDYA